MDGPAPDNELRPRRRVGQFELFTEVASGGMATVHLGRVIGAGDFARVVAIKRLHAHFAKDPIFTRMFLDEARVVARIRHPNVTPTIDLIEEEGELFIVMEYVEGETFAALLRAARRRKERVPVGVGVRIMAGALHGLHAAHEATNERGEPLNLVHRDVSPENIMVGTDGYPRLLDFGIARALGSFSQTREGEVKGKLAYMTPEQILGEPVTRRTDVFSASVVLWQALTGRQLFRGKHVGEYTHKILYKAIDPPSYVIPDLPKKYDTIVLKGLSREPEERWPSALAMAEALEGAGGMATQREVGVWVRRLASAQLSVLARKVKAVEGAPHGATPLSIPPVQSAEEAIETDDPLADTRALVSARAAAAGPRGYRRQVSEAPPSSDENPPAGDSEDAADAHGSDAAGPLGEKGLAPRPAVPPPPPRRGTRRKPAPLPALPQAAADEWPAGPPPPAFPTAPPVGGRPSAPPPPRYPSLPPVSTPTPMPSPAGPPSVPPTSSRSARPPRPGDPVKKRWQLPPLGGAPRTPAKEPDRDDGLPDRRAPSADEQAERVQEDEGPVRAPTPLPAEATEEAPSLDAATGEEQVAEEPSSPSGPEPGAVAAPGDAEEEDHGAAVETAERSDELDDASGGHTTSKTPTPPAVAGESESAEVESGWLLQRWHRRRLQTIGIGAGTGLVILLLFAWAVSGSGGDEKTGPAPATSGTTAATIATSSSGSEFASPEPSAAVADAGEASLDGGEETADAGEADADDAGPSTASSATTAAPKPTGPRPGGTATRTRRPPPIYGRH